MGRPPAPVLIGAALLYGSALSLAGWWARAPGMLGISPGEAMVFNAGLCFALAALALLVDGLPPVARRRLQMAAGMAIATLSAGVLLAHAVGSELGINWPVLHLWLADGTAQVARMATTTGIGFVVTGVVLVLKHRVKARHHVFILCSCNLAIGAMGLSALAGHILGLRYLYTDYWLAQMAPGTAAGFVLLSVGLWTVWRGESWNEPLLIRSEAARILLASTIIMTSIATVCGFAAFVLMQRSAEQAVTRELVRTLDHKGALIADLVAARTAEAERFAARHYTGAAVRVLAASSRRADGLAKLESAAAQALVHGFSGAAVQDRKGEVIAKAGEVVRYPDVALRVRAAGRAELIWSDEFLLANEIEISEGGAVIGTVILQTRMPQLASLLTDIPELGATGELLVCAQSTKQIGCLPTRLRPHPLFLQANTRGSPISFAFAGRTGHTRFTDSRGYDAIVAYGPIEPLGVAAVLRENTSDLYAPIREQLMYIVPFIAILLVAGVVIMRCFIMPLARKLAVSQTRLKLALSGSHLALWDWDVKSGRVYLSAHWNEMVGGDARTSTRSFEQLRELVHPDDMPRLSNHLRAVLKGLRSQYCVDHRVRTAAGEWKWIHSVGKVVERSADGRALRLIGTNADIHSRKQMELLAAHQAKHDALTGLPNRLLLAQRLKRAVARCRCHQRLMAVMYLDLDDFKIVNDESGHLVGDLLLKAFAARLADCVRQTDTVARLGGDEFAVVLEALSSEQAGRCIAQHIVAAMHRPFALDGRIYRVTASVGIAFFDGSGGMDEHALLKEADDALYGAKAAGRDQYRELSPAASLAALAS